MSPIKIVMTKMPVNSVSFYRMYQPLIRLIENYPDEFILSIASLDELPEALQFADVFMTTSTGTPEWLKLFQQIKELDKQRVKDGAKPLQMVLDIDDHIFINPSNPAYGYLGTEECVVELEDGTVLKWENGKTVTNNSGVEVTFNTEENKKRLGAYHDIIRMADDVICTTNFLRNNLLDYNKSVTVIPNAINTDKYKYMDRSYKPTASKIRIGYVAGRSHLDDWQTMKPELIKICKENPNVQVVLMFNDPLAEQGFPKGQIETVIPTTISNGYFKVFNNLNLDIGIAYTEENIWNLSRSNLKQLEYSAVGVPVLASRCLYGNYIKDGVDGMLFGDLADFRHKLRQLIKSPQTRIRLADGGYKLVRDKYELNKIIPMYREFFRRNR